jgi:anti-anti-sigma factor
MRVANGVVILYAVPGVTPEHADVELLCEKLVASGGAPRVVFDMSDLELISSALTARLIAVNKRVRGAKGKFVLCGLCSFVLETFQGSRLDRVFNIADDEEAALASF